MSLDTWRHLCNLSTCHANEHDCHPTHTHTQKIPVNPQFWRCLRCSDSFPITAWLYLSDIHGVLLHILLHHDSCCLAPGMNLCWGRDLWFVSLLIKQYSTEWRCSSLFMDPDILGSLWQLWLLWVGLLLTMWYTSSAKVWFTFPG